MLTYDTNTLRKIRTPLLLYLWTPHHKRVKFFSTKMKKLAEIFRRYQFFATVASKWQHLRKSWLRCWSIVQNPQRSKKVKKQRTQNKTGCEQNRAPNDRCFLTMWALKDFPAHFFVKSLNTHLERFARSRRLIWNKLHHVSIVDTTYDRRWLMARPLDPK